MSDKPYKFLYWDDDDDDDETPSSNKHQSYSDSLEDEE